MKNEKCPCDTGKPYIDCCYKLHAGALPDNALALMRSRYSAYAKGLIDYIIETTHPNHPDKKRVEAEWRKEIRAFSERTKFLRLEILHVEEGENLSYVTFKAHLLQDGKEFSFIERSRFEKLNGRWLYVSAE